jgi:hypothetical protein
MFLWKQCSIPYLVLKSLSKNIKRIKIFCRSCGSHSGGNGKYYLLGTLVFNGLYGVISRKIELFK